MDGSTTHTGADDAWQVIRVDVAEPLADAVASFLADEGLATLVIETPEPGSPAVGGDRATLAVHVPEARAAAVTKELTRWIISLAAIEPAARDVRVTTTPLPAVDWQAVFRHHHHPLPIGERLLVAPPWEVPEAPGREVLVIEPGMAFGTGQHETTRSCLEEIELATAGGTVQSALDVGTGSGILAAALARLGVPRVVAIDSDGAVLPLARANLARNHADGVALVAGGIDALRHRFDLVVANLLADTLVAHADALTSLLGVRGRLVVSGVLDTQADAIAATFPALRLSATRSAGSWRTLRLER